MNIVVRNPIKLDCGTLLSRHLQIRLHHMNINHSGFPEHIMIQPIVIPCNLEKFNELMDMIATHSNETFSLTHRSSGYYNLDAIE